MNSFSQIIEQERAIAEFTASFRNDSLNHTYLLTGDEGVGKMSLAYAVAARYLCLNPVDADSCGECRSCRLLKHGNHPDFLELPREPVELRIRRFISRSGSSNEAIEHKPILEFMRLKPMNGNGRVCIIPEAERINIEAANAFLKTLEEPPAHSLIILTSANKDRLLPTIISRCRIIGLSRLNTSAITEYLNCKLEIPGEQAEQIATLAEGSLGKAMALISSDTLENWEQICNIANYSNPVEAVRFAQILCQMVKAYKDSTAKRQFVLKILDLFSLYIRQQLRKGLSGKNGYKALEVLWNAADILGANVRPELVTLNAIIKLVTALHKG